MKKIFKFKVVETVEKYVEVEASTRDEAEMIASMEDMSKNYDDYSLVTTLLEEVHDDCNYPVFINGWNLVSPDNLIYWRRGKRAFAAVCLHKVDTGWVVVKGIGNDATDALADLTNDPFPISDVMERDWAEKMLLDWMESEEG